MRREAPVHRCEPAGFEPFSAITRHADICEISKRPDRFLNGRGIVVMNDEPIRIRASGQGPAAMRTIIEMDPPEHRRFRKVVSPSFTPRAVRALDQAVRESARNLVDKLAGSTGEGTCDFATEVAAAHPLRILSTILGVPPDLELRGRKIREGDNRVLFYASANRDEDVFVDPFAFRVDRSPYPHLGFGIGDQFRIGAHLARKFQHALWAELSQRLEYIARSILEMHAS